MSEMKKGILAVSFGTCCTEAREKTIDRMEEEMRLRYPDRSCYRAISSDAVREEISLSGGSSIDDAEAALKRMAADGVNEVLIQPVFMIRGIEYDRLLQTARGCRPLFASVCMGDPLLAMREDRLQMIQIITQEIALPREETLVLMGHGSEHAGGSAYGSLDRQFKEMGYPHIFVGTVKGDPSFGTVMRRLKKRHTGHVTLAPLLMTAGEPALRDLAGEGEESWKNRLEAEGFPVTCIPRGLLEYPRVRNLILDHMESAEEIDMR